MNPVGWVDDGGLVFWKDRPPADGTDLYAAVEVTLRDKFAMHAMFGLLAQPNFHPIHNASYCYEVADAMLEARKA